MDMWLPPLHKRLTFLDEHDKTSDAWTSVPSTAHRHSDFGDLSVRQNHKLADGLSICRSECILPLDFIQKSFTMTTCLFRERPQKEIPANYQNTINAKNRS
jgi:hypothetical protein